MENGVCPKISACRLFNGEILKRAESENTYKNLYCNNFKKWHTCRRYIFSQKYGMCPDFVLPNSSLSDEMIVVRQAGLEAEAQF